MSTRTVEQVDYDLEVERRIWGMERRNGERTNATIESWARIDRLLDERITAAGHLAVNPVPGVPAHFTP